MKKTFKFFAAALAIVAAVSCAKENIQDTQTDINDGENIELVAMTFNAGICSPSNPTGTKTTLVDGLNVHWSEGDNVLVYRYKANTTQDKFSPNQGYKFQVVANSIAEDVAAFEGSAADHSMYAAIYPYNCVNISDSNASSYVFEMATLKNQTASINNFPTTPWGCANISMTRGTNKGDRFVFENRLAYFKFNVQLDNVYSIEITADKVAYLSPTNLSDSRDLGSTLVYSVADDAFYMNSGDDPIILENNGSPFVVGQTYYVAIPVVKMEGLTLSLKDKSSEELLAFNKQSFTPQRNTIYNLGTFKKAFLGVDVTSIDVAGKGGTQSINVNASGSVTVSSSASWLTVTYANSQCTINAQANETENDRSAIITVSCEGLTKEVKVAQSPKYYMVTGSVLTRASNLLDGHMYVVTLEKTGYSWKAYDSGLKMYKIEDDYQITAPFVYVYHRDDNESVNSNYGYGGNYSYMSAGSWKSRSIDEFLGYDFKFTSTEVFFTHMNGWRQNVNSGLVESTDIDIYKDGSAMLNYKGSFSWGNLGTDYYKWNFREVVEK